MSLYKKSIPKVDNTDKRKTRHFSNKQEKSVAKAVGGKTTANSGAPMFVGGDVKSDNVLYECKTKVKDSDSITLKKEWFTKNKQEMVFMGKDYSVIVFNFGPDQPNYYVLDELTYQEFLELKGNHNEG